ncbi:glucokinase [Gammaproteobacteria bacterium]|nr:glucokinase [Gammaproteobacteria bacterium]
MVINPESLSDQARVLLVDIGGTNVRTCSANIGSSELLNPQKNNTSCLKSFDALIANFLIEDPSIQHIVFSVAGPRLNDSISMTNRDFTLDANEVLKKFDISSCHVLNDWESIGHSLSLFNEGDMDTIIQGQSFNKTALILGPGTGLGAAVVVDNQIVLPTEIGNSTFSINSMLLDSELNHSEDFHVLEDLISGRGISNIYKEYSGLVKSSEEILMSYDMDRLAKKSINQFLVCLPQVLSELALAYMPGNGIYLAGGLMRSLMQHINPPKFKECFLMNRKIMHADVLANIPIFLIQKEMTCLHGNLNYINQLFLKNSH